MGENAILAHTDTHVQNVSVSKTHIPVYTVLFVMFVGLNLILLCNLVRLTFLIEPAGCFLPEFFHIGFFLTSFSTVSLLKVCDPHNCQTVSCTVLLYLFYQCFWGIFCPLMCHFIHSYVSASWEMLPVRGFWYFVLAV